MQHWAGPLIGVPWSADGEGPARFSCWGLVRWVFRERHGIDMPTIRLGDFTEGENVAAIKRAAEVSGWRRAEGEPELDDIVLMSGPDGRHVGVMIQYKRGLRLLIADGNMTAHGPVGSVVAQPLEDVLRGRLYTAVELWRRA